MKTVYERADIVPLLAEIFRELGYEGTSLSRITERTGIGKGSLYHFFPGGKQEMAGAVLADVDGWFEDAIYQPLRKDDAREAIAAMWTNVNDYFRSGRRICLVGAFALDETRERFSTEIGYYFIRWIDALRSALMRAGCSEGRRKRSPRRASRAFRARWCYRVRLMTGWFSPGPWTRWRNGLMLLCDEGVVM